MKLAHRLEIWATVFRTRVALRYWPERELAYALRSDASPSSATGPAIHAASVSLTRKFRRTTRSVANGRCLLLSVAGIRFLRRRGLPASLRIGFTPGFQGHAWIDCDGDAYAERFRPFHCTAAGLAALLTNRRSILTPPEELVGSTDSR